MCLAVPGKVISVVEEAGLGWRRGKVDFGGVQKEVCLAYTPEAGIGDYVLVHVGFALNVVDEQEARRIFDVLAEMQRLEELEVAGDLTESGS
jgi:hydrogenase expression/formation protein HypC